MNQYVIAAKLIFNIIYENKNQKIVFLNREYTAQITSWVYSCCRFSIRLKFILDKLCHKPFKKDMKQLEALLLLGLLLCVEKKRPLPIIVSQIVEASVELQYPKCKALVNAILRNFIRKQDVIFKSFDDVALYSHSTFLLNIIRKNWPNKWKSIIAANNSKSMVHLRCRNIDDRDKILLNMPKGSRSSLLVDSGIILSKSEHLLNLIEGSNVCVQDAGAQALLNFLPATAGINNILDAGAAPGGKTALLSDFYKKSSILAVDNSEQRLKILEKNIKSWNISNVKIMQQDLTNITTINDVYDLIVLDAPCTGSGVISRQPDIKNKINKRYLAQCVNKQRKMFFNLWSLLQEGGYFIYATCSILKKEGHSQIDFFSDNLKDLVVVNKDCYMEYILPTEWNNGFYFCLLQKKS